MLTSILLCVPLVVAADGPEVLRVGHWVEVRGRFDGTGTLIGSRVQLLEPEKYQLLIGTVPERERDPERFRLHGQPVHVSERTDWEGLRPGSVAGRRIKVEGRWRGPGKLSAREVSPRGEGRDRIGGRIDAIRSVEGGYELEVMRFLVFVAADTEVEHDEPLDEIPLAEAVEITAFESVGSDRVEPDDDDLFGEGIRLRDDLWVEGQLEFRWTDESELDLDRSDPEERTDTTLSARTRLNWVPSERFAAVAELRHRQLWRDDEEDGYETRGDLDLGESFVYLTDVWPALGLGRRLDLALGRLDFDDQREWIYDQNLDALQAIWVGSRMRVELATATTFGGDADQRDRSSNDWIAYLSNTGRDRHLAAWTVHRNLDSRNRSTHLGLRALGEWLPDVESWADVAYLDGERSGASVSAWGYDVGATWTPDRLAPFSFTVGYALGSGDDDPGSGTDTTFRQTGLQDNNSRFDGATSFRYYGELVDPELANLGILSLGLGARPTEDTSVDLVFHDYLQDQAQPVLLDSDLDADPDGIDPDIGWELDVIFGARWASWDVELVGAWFRPGDAFSDGDDAFLAKVQLRYRF